MNIRTLNLASFESLQQDSHLGFSTGNRIRKSARTEAEESTAARMEKEWQVHDEANKNGGPTPAPGF